MRFFRYCLLVLLLTPLARADEGRRVVLHLPGISGPLAVDRTLVRGLLAGGADTAEVYDWTFGRIPVGALVGYEANQRQAQVVADRIERILKDDPAARVVLTGHSGGTGIAVWALEKLPDGVQVESLVLLASALSPDYDLTSALRHVRGRAVAFGSPYDRVVLETGTKTLGTIDRVYAPAAGFAGFNTPASADPAQYAKLTQYPYDKAWSAYGNAGGHIGTMASDFARFVLTPAIEGRPLPTTQPTR